MNRQLLEKFFKGECSSEGYREVLAWYLSGEADQELSEKIEAYWKEEAEKNESLWGKESLFETINEQLSVSAKEEKPSNKRKKQPPRQQWKGWSYAAAIALIIFSSGWGYYFSVYENLNQASNQAVAHAVEQEKIVIKQTARGEKLVLILPDSTVVKLNSESQLRYHNGLGQTSSREVYLEGEAFFEVARDTLHPFQIHTANITTTVLGTSFNIKAFAGENEIAVSVVSGEVQVAQQDAMHEQRVFLIPGEQAVYTNTDTVFAKKKFDEQDILSWKEGRLYFKNAGFSEVIATLERWYGVEIEVQRKGIEDGFSGSYTNRSLESVLEGMSFVLNFEYEMHDKKIIIK